MMRKGEDWTQLSIILAVLLLGPLKTNTLVRHLPDRGPFDELSTTEFSNALNNLGKYLDLDYVGAGIFVTKGTTLDDIPPLQRIRAVRVALEVPPKSQRNGTKFTRLARISLYAPKLPFVHEYVVSTGNTTKKVSHVRRIPALRRPVDEIETSALDDFLAITCQRQFGQFLEDYYQAAFVFAGPRFDNKTAENLCTKQTANGSNRSSAAYRPACLFGMFASPRVTWDRPQRRITVFRLSRVVPPYNQHPTDVFLEIDHTENNFDDWRLIGLQVQGHHYDNMDAFLAAKHQWPHLFVRHKVFKSFFEKTHVSQLGDKLCPRQLSRRDKTPTKPFSGSVTNKHVVYGPWDFDVGVLYDTGLRFYNIHFNGRLVIHEVGLDETVTSYGGDTPFMRAMTSIESMYAIGSLTSELSPGLDCPLDAVYLSVPIIPSVSEGPISRQNGICIYASSADVHNGPLRRHYQPFVRHDTVGSMGYGIGVTEESLYVVIQAAVFNYQYALVNVFSPTGSFSTYVVPSGYIHVDVVKSNDLAFGHIFPQMNLRFNVHTHHFLFFVDALGDDNRAEQTRAFGEYENRGIDRMNMQVRRLATEKEGRVTGSDPTTINALCLASSSKCLQVINFAPLRSLVSWNASRSFQWIRHNLWFTRYKKDELRASSIYNGIDLTSPVVDFDKFSTNETLSGDLVMWISVGFVHIPVNEDIPQTSNKGSQVGFMLKPHNFFPQTPDVTSKGTVFTLDEAQWMLGFTKTTPSQCGLINRTSSSELDLMPV
uniref:Amine oxidase n=1 Tax=Mesocestoides corti TaxID=53468 RepID=A0A5K3EWE0_MESCO